MTRFSIIALAALSLGNIPGVNDSHGALSSANQRVSESESKTIHGKIDAAGDGKITIIDGKEDRQTFTVDKGAKITLDGKATNLGDLPKGASAAVTTQKGNENLAVMIAADSPE